MRISLLDRFIDPEGGLRRHPVAWTLVFSALQIVEEYLLGFTAGPDRVIGVTGALSVLIAVTAAIFIGIRSGVVVAVVGTGAFYVFVGGYGSTTPLASTVIAGVVWIAAAILAGLVADSLRAEMVARRRARDAVVELHERLGRNLLPSIPGTVAGCRVATLYRPGEERIELGGDFFDVLDLGDGTLAVVIGDVSGHGPDAASLGAGLRTAWQSLVRARVDPTTMVSALADVLEREMVTDGTFATLCMARVDPGAATASLILLGHPPPLLAAATVGPLTVEPLPPVGVARPPRVTASEHPLPADWSLLFYTDGLVEGHAAPVSRERYGVERLAERLRHECLAGACRPGPQTCLEALVADAEAANGGPLPDDVAALLISRG